MRSDVAADRYLPKSLSTACIEKSCPRVSCSFFLREHCLPNERTANNRAIDDRTNNNSNHCYVLIYAQRSSKQLVIRGERYRDNIAVRADRPPPAAESKLSKGAGPVPFKFKELFISRITASPLPALKSAFAERSRYARGIPSDNDPEVQKYSIGIAIEMGNKIESATSIGFEMGSLQGSMLKEKADTQRIPYGGKYHKTSVVLTSCPSDVAPARAPSERS
ncbi:hypothetical protein EVAR_16972_1 [Eumeta japonica]|uniref:Uncharacterized protein n=1 Tax=Eumeta variegata TaxID=151549 RepID=A0A4C1TWJ8_EUMVA|nr:hypothetical protein EVAR_16972_1 [Eumeta japonica]